MGINIPFLSHTLNDDMLTPNILEALPMLTHFSMFITCLYYIRFRQVMVVYHRYSKAVSSSL